MPTPTDPGALVTLDEVREMFDHGSNGATRKELVRRGIHPVSRQPGRGGMSLYARADVAAALATRPGRGARTDLATSRQSGATP